MSRYGAVACTTFRQNNQFKVSIYFLKRYVGHTVSAHQQNWRAQGILTADIFTNQQAR